MLNATQAVDHARALIAGPRFAELDRLDKIAEAVKPWTADNAMSKLVIKGIPQAHIDGLGWRAQTNFLPLVLDVYAQSMKVDNYLASTTKETAGPWQWWLKNKMASAQTGLIRSVLQYGTAYNTVLPASAPPGAEQPVGKSAIIRPLSPRQLTVMYGDPTAWRPGETPVDTDWPIEALELNGLMIRLYDETAVHFIGIQMVPKSGTGVAWSDPVYNNANNFHYIEARPHDVGVCPVVRYRDRWLLEGEEQLGIIEPLINIQARIDETSFEMLVAQYFTAFAQRWVSGWRPKNDSEALRQAASDTWYFAGGDKEVKVGQFDAGSLDGYDKSGQAARRDFSAIAQLPATALGIDAISNISEATIAGLEAGKDRKAAEICTSLGESFEQTLRTCAHITGDPKGAADFEADVNWQDVGAREFAATIDGLGKMAVMLNIPPEILLEDVPGWNKAKIDRALAAMKERDAKLRAEPRQGPTDGEFPPGEADPQAHAETPAEPT